MHSKTWLYSQDDVTSYTPIPPRKITELDTAQVSDGFVLLALCLKIILFHTRTSLSWVKLLTIAYIWLGRSTTQCSWATKEVTSFYNRTNNTVYDCLLDCSKAFDNVPYHKDMT